MATTKKTTTAKKTTTKKSVAKQQTEPQKVSKTGLAMREMAKDPWFKVNDWRAVNR